ncbi:uncharacterized protein LOC117652417 [Thrips palmi]|uniref:Uncharacterized protein LOC117652417 n=1 Tax=Thrips palmi TaxID=161013 RepID=A0A6P9A5G8_THRPL|nr:uncharacterized protein LOC117652417 [Thrips palmi]
MRPAPSGSAISERQGRRQHALYRKFYQEACQKLQAESFLARQRAEAHTDYETTYGEIHGLPGFEPSLERQLREGAALSALQPVCDVSASEPALSLWYCRQRSGTAARTSMPLSRVSPAHCATRPFRRTAAFTTPTHLGLHESPVEQPRPPPRLSLVDRLDVQGWRRDGWGAAGPVTPRYPLADVLPEVFDGRRPWCDRREDPVRVPDDGNPDDSV